jgi:hypothetical protein
MIFILGVLFGVMIAGSCGYTWDRRIVSGQPFAVDDEIYQCKFVGRRRGPELK